MTNTQRPAHGGEAPIESTRLARASHAPPAASADRATAADWAEAKRTPKYLYSAVLAHTGWPENQVVAEYEYDRAVDDVGAIEVR